MYKKSSLDRDNIIIEDDSTGMRKDSKNIYRERIFFVKSSYFITPAAALYCLAGEIDLDMIWRAFWYTNK